MGWEQVATAIIALAILCGDAHAVSPMVLAWSHSGLRTIALSRPIETMLLPALAVIGALAAPLWIVWAIYTPWNVYHYGAQHYGVSRLLGLQVPKWLCIGGTALVLESGLLFGATWWKWCLLIVLNFQHWLVDIGLSSRVSGRWWLFLPAVLALGCVGFAWQIPTADGIDGIVTLALPLVIKARWGVGIVHFLYSRRVWKLSDPQVGAIIRKDLLHGRTA